MTNSYLAGITPALRLCFLTLYVLYSLSTSADDLPTFEFGLGLGGQHLPDYRGSDELNTIVLPVPILIYRGDKFRIDRGGLRGDLVNKRWWEINFSGEATLNGDDGDNQAREGLPELDSSFEFGPSLNISLDGNVDDDGWLLQLPVRAAVAVGENGVEFIGTVVNPRISYAKDSKIKGLRFSASLGALWASERNHDYFYQVDQQFVQVGRPFFDAEAGFSGVSIEGGVGRRTRHWLLGVNFRYDNISGAVFADSPLVQTDDFFSVSFIFARYLWASKG